MSAAQTRAAQTRAGERLPYLLSKLKAPRVLERLEQTAALAREQSWPYEQFLESLLEAEVFAREASGAVALRVRPRKGAFTWADDAARSGGSSLRVDPTVYDSSKLARWMTLTDAIRVTAGVATTASAWLHTANVNGGFAVIAVSYWTASSGYVGASTGTSDPIVGKQDRRQLAVTTTAPHGAATIRVEFRRYGSGTLWADDLWVVRAG